MTTKEQLKAIVPGKTYPSEVEITEKDGRVIKFLLNSYYCGMYCAIYANGNLAMQTGDHNNKKFTTGLKRDVIKALKRGAIVEIDSVRDVKVLD